MPDVQQEARPRKVQPEESGPSLSDVLPKEHVAIRRRAPVEESEGSCFITYVCHDCGYRGDQRGHNEFTGCTSLAVEDSSGDACD